MKSAVNISQMFVRIYSEGFKVSLKTLLHRGGGGGVPPPTPDSGDPPLTLPVCSLLSLV